MGIAASINQEMMKQTNYPANGNFLTLHGGIHQPTLPHPLDYINPGPALETSSHTRLGPPLGTGAFFRAQPN